MSSPSCRRTDREILWEQTLYLNVLLHEVSQLFVSEYFPTNYTSLAKGFIIFSGKINFVGSNFRVKPVFKVFMVLFLWMIESCIAPGITQSFHFVGLIFVDWQRTAKTANLEFFIIRYHNFLVVFISCDQCRTDG